MATVEELLQKQRDKRMDEAKIASKLDEDSDLAEEARQKFTILLPQTTRWSSLASRTAVLPFLSTSKNDVQVYPKLWIQGRGKGWRQPDAGWQAFIAELAKTTAIPSAANNNTKSVPQIFINQKYIGGADDLADIYLDKTLATMLGRDI